MASELTTEMKNFFFDRKRVKDAMDKATRVALVRSLAFVRKVQRNSIRRNKKISEPGKPPRSHSTRPVESVKNILFAYDEQTKSGIVGMVKINGRRAKVNSNQELPDLLEFGGPMRIEEVSWDAITWRSPSPRRIRKLRKDYPNVQYRRRAARMRARPSAGPALERANAAGMILSPWANVVGQ